ncbi:MAG: prepilin-type N-terminal cleavage/methylation domain-containing protein [Sedimentisphaerales bacterium]|nr:prepilin-type N-terminal cleavage/methylation domain-containing protein [Sedimentisphaerales bacterium]
MHNKRVTFCSEGFTLIECLIAIFLIGVAIVALVASSASLTRVNAAGTELSTAEFLIEQIRELTDMVAVFDPEGGTYFGPEEGSPSLYDDVDDFDNASFCPPITSDRQSLTDFAAYTQTVIVEKIDESDFEQTLPDSSPSDYVRVTVSVLLNGNEITSARWIRANY